MQKLQNGITVKNDDQRTKEALERAEAKKASVMPCITVRLAKSSARLLDELKEKGIKLIPDLESDGHVLAAFKDGEKVPLVLESAVATGGARPTILEFMGPKELRSTYTRFAVSQRDFREKTFAPTKRTRYNNSAGEDEVRCMSEGHGKVQAPAKTELVVSEVNTDGGCIITEYTFTVSTKDGAVSITARKLAQFQMVPRELLGLKPAMDHAYDEATRDVEFWQERDRQNRIGRNGSNHFRNGHQHR